MAIPLNQILEGRGACPVHVQVEIDERTPPSQWPGSAQVLGRIVRVFRGDLALETQLSLNLAVIQRGVAVPMGDFYYDWDHVRDARFLELFLQRSGETLRVPSNSYTKIIDAPSEVPQLQWTAPSAAANRLPWLERVLRWIGRR